MKSRPQMGSTVLWPPSSTKIVLNTAKIRVAVISAKNHKRQRRKRQSVTAKREKSQTQWVAVISAKKHKRQRRKR